MNNIQVWYSPNNESSDLIGSQLYHFDREDFRQIKCFIPIEDIDKDCGPITLISAKNSKNSDTLALERDISDSLGLPIDIRHKGERGGEIKVAYKTLEQLDEVCRRLAHSGA